MSDARPGSQATSRVGAGPARAILAAIAVVAVIIVIGAVFMFHGSRMSNPISTAGSASRETTAPGDHNKEP